MTFVPTFMSLLLTLLKCHTFIAFKPIFYETLNLVLMPKVFKCY